MDHLILAPVLVEWALAFVRLAGGAAVTAGVLAVVAWMAGSGQSLER